MGIFQSNRGAAIATPLGADVLAIRTFQFNEELSAEFHASVEMLSTNFDIDPKDLLGKEVTIRLELMTGERYFHAVVTEFSFTGSTGTHATYQATLRPWTWVMGQKTDCRTFVNKTVPTIIKEIIKEAGVPAEYYDDGNLSDTYSTREFCVQYNESDTNFIFRLMYEEGISFFFKHENDKHVLTVSDWNDDFEPMGGYEVLQYFPETGQQRTEEHVYGWHLRNALTPGAHATTDYDFKVPRKDMMVSSKAPDGHANDDREVFQWPGGFIERADGERFAKVRRELHQAGRARVVGTSNARGLSAGHLFNLINFPRADQNRAYLLLTVTHDFHATDYETGGEGGAPWYECRFTCSDPKLLYRPANTSMRPRIVGPQTAIVVGPKGEEIWTDEHGRIKVRFHWDRHSGGHSKSSNWIRVAQPWAGKGWGGQHIPRIGQEVVIEFLEGDPDRPICTGAVYNGDNQYPFTLPENKTQSGIRSNSTKDGTGFNQFVFEDKKGEEYIHTVAEKDMVTDVKNDKHLNVGNNYVRTVHADEATEITGQRQLVVDKNEMVQVTQDRWVEVTGKQYFKIGPKLTFDCAGDILMQATNSITLQVGDSKIQITPGGITINGGQIDTIATGVNNIKGGKVTLN